MLSGAGVIDSKAGEKIIHTTFEGTVKAGTDNDYVIVKADDIIGYQPITATAYTKAQSIGGVSIVYEDYKMYGMILDDNQSSVVDYLGSYEILNSEVLSGADSKSGASKGDLVITLKPDTEHTYDGHVCRIDCYSITENAAVTTLTVDADNFGGTFYIEAETLFRDEATGHDFPATFIIPKGKIQGNFTFNMASSGDPSTFDFTIDCTVGAVRGLSNKKVLYAIDIIDNISSTDSHSDKNTTKDWSTTTATYGATKTTN